MKKIIALLTLLTLTLFLVACGNDSANTRNFELKQGGVVSTVKYTVEGDKVMKQSAENVINYEAAGFPSKEVAKQQIDPISEQFQNIEGLTQSIEYEDTQAIERMTVDYQTVDFDEIKELPGMNFDEGVKEKGVSMKESAKLLEEAGYKEIK